MSDSKPRIRWHRGRSGLLLLLLDRDTKGVVYPRPTGGYGWLAGAGRDPVRHADEQSAQAALLEFLGPTAESAV